ncbi:hypothetical protein CHARACLAT_006350, partial [Characodon lateralis]|nr:hypothetical protein [Characodon lateralis]
MTIKNALRDHGQRYRPRMACLKKFYTNWMGSVQDSSFSSMHTQTVGRMGAKGSVVITEILFGKRMTHSKAPTQAKAEKVLLEMQDPCTGVKSQPQRLVITIIPHAINGEDIIAWLADRFQIDTEEARSFGSMLVALGYIYPLQDHKRLVIKPDASLYRFQ